MRSLAASGLLLFATLLLCRWAQEEIDRAWPDLATATRRGHDYHGRTLWVASAIYRDGALEVEETTRVPITGSRPDIPDGTSVTARVRYDAARNTVEILRIEPARSEPWRVRVDYAASAAVVLWLIGSLGRVFQWTIGPDRMIVRRT